MSEGVITVRLETATYPLVEDSVYMDMLRKAIDAYNTTTGSSCGVDGFPSSTEVTHLVPRIHMDGAGEVTADILPLDTSLGRALRKVVDSTGVRYFLSGYIRRGEGLSIAGVGVWCSSPLPEDE